MDLLARHFCRSHEVNVCVVNIKSEAILEHGLCRGSRWSSSLDSVSKGVSLCSTSHIECAESPSGQTLSPDRGEESISLLSLTPKETFCSSSISKVQSVYPVLLTLYHLLIRHVPHEHSVVCLFLVS